MGYNQCQTDHTLFVKAASDGKLYILIVYVDDIFITGDYVEEIRNFKKLLAIDFEGKDLGNRDIFLGWKLQDLRMASQFLKGSIH